MILFVNNACKAVIMAALLIILSLDVSYVLAVGMVKKLLDCRVV